MEENSLDAIVTDPPYGLEFMGKEWDKLEPARNSQRWRGTVPHLIGSGKGKGGDLGARMNEMPHFVPKRNAKCRECGHYKFSGTPCKCESPDWDYRSGEHLKFMQQWHHQWAIEALRVLKPGGHLVAFGGERTYHRLACAVEDAGFDVRTMLVWVFGSGFPKSLNISKQIDKAAGAERRIIGRKVRGDVEEAKQRGTGYLADPANRNNTKQFGYGVENITVPTTDAAKKWQGWGTALKPAATPILLARKPLSEPNVAANVLKWGTGGLNIDGCRIGAETRLNSSKPRAERIGFIKGFVGGTATETKDHGRWPANFILSHAEGCERIGEKKTKSNGHWTNKRQIGNGIIYSKGGYRELDEGNRLADRNGYEAVESWRCVEGCPVGMFPTSKGQQGNVQGNEASHTGDENTNCYGEYGRIPFAKRNDTGSAARFFYCAKAATKERWFLCKTCGTVHPAEERPRHKEHDLVYHPTQKPIELMRWLIRLVTPSKGMVLDPFVGTGSTAIAAHLEHMGFVGIERDGDYERLCSERIEKETHQSLLDI